jgi:hypothetical protein
MVSWVPILASTVGGISVVLGFLRQRLDLLIGQAASDFDTELRNAINSSPPGSPLPTNRLLIEMVVRVSSKRFIGAALYYAGSILLLVSVAGVVTVDLGILPAAETYILLPAAFLMVLFWCAFASAFVVVVRER